MADYDSASPKFFYKRNVLSHLDQSIYPRSKELTIERQAIQAVAKRCRDNWGLSHELSWAAASDINQGFVFSAWYQPTDDEIQERAAQIYKTDPFQTTKFPLTTSDAWRAISYLAGTTTHGGASSSPLKRLDGDGNRWQKQDLTATLICASLLEPEFAKTNDATQFLTKVLRRAPLQKRTSGVNRDAAIRDLDQRWAGIQATNDDIKAYLLHSMAGLPRKKQIENRDEEAATYSRASPKYWTFRTLGADTSAVDRKLMIGPVLLADQVATKIEESRITSLRESNQSKNGKSGSYLPIRIPKHSFPQKKPEPEPESEEDLDDPF